MKIGLICPYSFDRSGGVQNHIFGLASWLREQGHEVRIAGPGRDPRAFCLGRALPVPFNGSTARICLDPRVGSRLKTWASGLDLVHIHEPLVPLVGLLASRLPMPTIFTCHAATSARLHRVIRPLMRDWSSSQVIAVSEPAARAPRAAGITPHLIGNGVSARLADCDQRATRVVFVGRRDEPRKGFDTFAAAMRMLAVRRSDLEVVVVGDGCRREAGFSYRGVLSDDQRDLLLRSARVFVAPNLGGESFGIVLLEALAAGADIVASDLEAFREVLTDEKGEVARLVPPGDPEALMAAVDDALRNGPIGSLARRHSIASSFDWSSIGPQITSVYEASLTIA